MTKENKVKYGFRIPQDMFKTENSNQVSLPVAGEHRSFLYAIYSHYLQFCIKSNIRYADELQYISQLSTIYVYDYVKHFNLKSIHWYYYKIYY